MTAGAVQLFEGLQRLGWIEAAAVVGPEPFVPDDRHAGCWLRGWLDGARRQRPFLNREGRNRLERLVAEGWTLRSIWPRAWSATVERWLGRRLILTHASQFADSTRWISLISSRIGRHGSQHPEWPQWLEGALRYAQQQRAQLLVAPGSTLAETVEQLAPHARLPTTKVVWTNHTSLTAWLHELMTSTQLQQTGRNPAQFENLFLSPPLTSASESLQRFPLQDRISIALADWVLALTLRRGGKLEELVGLRLQDGAFPLGSLFITLPPTQAPGLPCSARRTPPTGRSADAMWLDRGAVGWLAAPLSTPRRGPLRHCQAVVTPQAAVFQLSSPLPQVWRTLTAAQPWPYLVHCTRGKRGPLPEESDRSFRYRAWDQVEEIVWDPLETLGQIVHEARLRSTSQITRTGTRCVSFSAVPLVPLLQRRVFRSHLGRWDWEPYGLLIRRDALELLGARPVIYGDEDDFDRLPAWQRTFFQPYQTRKNTTHTCWADEREWRVVDDVRLQKLPHDSVLIFVRTRCQANQFARHSPWPVLWIEG